MKQLGMFALAFVIGSGAALVVFVAIDDQLSTGVKAIIVVGCGLAFGPLFKFGMWRKQKARDLGMALRERSDRKKQQTPRN